MPLRPPSCIPAATTKQSLAETLSALKDGKYQAEPFKTEATKASVPMNILVDKNVVKGINEVEVHRHEADLWIAIDGEVYFEVGGSMVDPWAKKMPDGSTNDLELKCKTIAGGTTHKLSPGDILYIPEGQPHVHWTEAGKGGRLWIIKLPAKEVVPMREVPGWQG